MGIQDIWVVHGVHLDGGTLFQLGSHIIIGGLHMTVLITHLIVVLVPVIINHVSMRNIAHALLFKEFMYIHIYIYIYIYMPRTKIFCKNGIKCRDNIVSDARSHGFEVIVKFPKSNLGTLDIITESAEFSYLEQFENDPDIVIFYDKTHPKAIRTPFRANVIKSKNKALSAARPIIPQIYVDGLVYEDLIPPKMRDYYQFPTITNRPDNIRPKIGVISLGGYYRKADLERYWKEKCQLVGILPTVTDVVVDGNVLPKFTRDTASLENTIDLELIGGFCPSADITFYSADNSSIGYFTAFQTAINDGMDIISTSWGQCEDTFYGGPDTGVLDTFNALFKDGVTDPGATRGHYSIIVAASGDFGSSDENYTTYDVTKYYPDITIKVPVPHADFPASSPWVTSCGATSLYWDHVLGELGNQESSWMFGGGGQSSHFERPSYQGPWRDTWPISPICKRDKITNQPFARTLPDVVFNGDPNSPWIMIFDDYDDEASGTSACAPIMAALLGEFYVGSQNDNAAPRNGYFGEGFNVNIYRVPTQGKKRIFLGYNVTVDRNPITKEVNPFGYFGIYPDGKPVPESRTFYGIWSDSTAYSFCCGLGAPKGEPILVYLDTVVCVAHGTKILMAGGNEQLICQKPIEQIVRGDYVIGYNNQKFRVADINRQFIAKNATIDIIEFPPNSLGKGYPLSTLLVTPNHPIFYKGARRPAKSFRALPNVIEHKNIKPGTILHQTEIDETGPIYYLYDLQFDDDGSYLAEGVTVQSRSPWSNITPLDKDLYFEPSRYKAETHWDGFNHPLPLDERELFP
jgi:hypothetical protein